MIIQCNNVNKSYAFTPILTGFNLDLKVGESLAIVGKSGCGKSTLLNILAGIDRVDSGELSVCSQDLIGLDEKKLSKFRLNNIGFIYQLHHLLVDFNAIENIMMPLLIKGFSKQEAHKKASDILQDIGLINRKEHFINQLSGGERQRVAIARAIVGKPKLVLADEPTGNLDAVNANKSIDLLLDLKDKYNSSLLIVTHDEGIAKRVGNTLSLV